MRKIAENNREIEESRSMLDSHMEEFLKKIESLGIEREQFMAEAVSDIERSVQNIERASSFITSPFDISFSNPLLIGGVLSFICVGGGIFLLKMATRENTLIEEVTQVLNLKIPVPGIFSEGGKIVGGLKLFKIKEVIGTGGAIYIVYKLLKFL